MRNIYIVHRPVRGAAQWNLPAPVHYVSRPTGKMIYDKTIENNNNNNVYRCPLWERQLMGNVDKWPVVVWKYCKVI